MCLISRFVRRLFGMSRHGYRSSTESASANDNKEKYKNMPIDEKRKLYKCKDDYVQLKDVPTWTEYYDNHLKISSQAQTKKVKSDKQYVVDEDLNKRISIWKGDITSLEIDAIVNAANRGLRGGGGVDGAIHSAAGHSLLQAECQEHGGCDTGDAVMTLGYKLPAKHVIHTVGPMGRNGSNDDDKLKSCYRRSLDILQEKNLKSIAFPCVSTGIYGFPNELAAPIAIETAREFLETEYGAEVDRIIFCLFMPVDVKLYEQYMQVFFPVATKSSPPPVRKEKIHDAHEKGDSQSANNSVPMSLDHEEGESQPTDAPMSLGESLNDTECELNLPEVPESEPSSPDAQEENPPPLSANVEKSEETDKD